MKKILLIVFLFCASFSFSQYVGVTTLKHDTCLDKKFSIVFYIVLDSNYSVGAANQASLTMLMDTLNRVFKHICVSFENCSTVLIPNYPYSKWKKNITDPVVRASWYAKRTINLYLVDSVKADPTNTEWLGYAYPPPGFQPDTTDAIVLQKGDLFLYMNFYPLFHHFGHFFGLSHTDDELNPNSPASPMPLGTTVSQEFVDGTNGDIHGDLLSDTEADPGPSSQLTDGKGRRYILPTDNYMSRYLGSRYTTQQFGVMAHKILTRRLYLH